MIYEKALNERARLHSRVEKLKKQIQRYPKENIIYSSDGKYTRYYASDGKNKVYIPVKNKSFAIKLATKKYISTLINDYSAEITALDSYIKYHETHSTMAETLLNSSSPYQSLLSSHFKTLSEEHYDWMHANYEKNNDHPETLIHSGLSGNSVRSKSEAQIDTLLTQNGIPFRYECKLVVGKSIFYPDFTIKHPITGQIYYWEHLGMMDNPEYREKSLIKLQTYINNGFIPNVNLIITYETQTNPLRIDYINTLINYYFL